MDERTAGGEGPSKYTTPIPPDSAGRGSAFQDWAGYGGFGGFIDTQEPRTPAYEDTVNAVADTLDKDDFRDPRYLQIIRDMAQANGIPVENAWWDVMDDPDAHAKAWKPNHPGFSYDWAHTTDSPFHDGYNELERNRVKVTPPAPPPPARTQLGPSKNRAWNTDEKLEWVKQHVGAIEVTAFDHEMDVDKQVRRARDRAEEARSRGNHEFADYLDDAAAIMARDAEDGRPEPWSHYWPMALEEFGDDHPEVAANPTPRRKGGIVAHREQVAMHYRAFAPPPADVGPPKMDWNKAMDSVRDTGGYTVGDAGEAPSSGYMISQPGTEERRPTDTVTPHTEEDYHKRHWDELAADPDAHQGGWGDKGTFYTDISRNDPNLWRTIGDAVTTDQLGVYDLNHHQTLDTSDDPDTDRDDYNPLLTGPGFVATLMPGKTTQERRDMWHHMGDWALQEAETNGFNHVDGDEFFRTAGPLQYQDQHSEAQYPTPPVDLPERRRRSLEKKFKQPAPALDPNATDDRIDMDNLVRNALSRYQGATDEQRETGRNWYADARRKLQGLVQATGGDFSKAAAIMAALSPQMDWEGNLNSGAHFLNSYNPAEKSKWRMPNLSPAAYKAWSAASGNRAPQTPEEWSALAGMAGTSDPDWAKEMAMDGRWDRAADQATNKGYRHRNDYTGTGLPALGDNVLRAMNVYDSPDPRQVMQYAAGPKIHSFWRNFLGDEDYVTIDKHMLRALDRPFGSDPLMSYGSGKPEVTRKKTPEDIRVGELEAQLSYKRSQKGDEQTVVPTGYNTYSEAIRRATAQVNAAQPDVSKHLTPAQMQAIIWVQHKGDMDAFAKRKGQEAWDARNPGKLKPESKPYTPALPIQPVPDYTKDNAWHQQNPYKGGEPRPLPVHHTGPSMSPDNIPDVDVEPDMTYVPRAAMIGVPW